MSPIVAGNLVLATGSVDQTENYVFVVEPQGVGRSFGKAGHYWVFANDFDTMYSLFNPTDRAQDFIVTIHYGDGSGSYQMPVHLEAQASTMIDMMMLIGEKRPDVHGNVIPPTVQQGSVVFESAKGVAQWMTLVVSGGVYNPRRGTCGVVCTQCYGYSGPVCVANPFAVAVQGTTNLHAQATYANGTVQDFTTSSSWSSNSTPVATVGSSTGVVTGQTVGSVTISAQFPQMGLHTGQICSGNPQCPVGAPVATSSGSVTPKILFGSNQTDITGTTQSVVVGQQITLTASYSLPSGVTVTSQSWSVGGTIVGGYSPSTSRTSVTAATLNQQSTTFYWGYPGSSLNVTFTLNLSTGPPAATATATFNVTGPSGGTMSTTPNSQVTIANLSSDTGCSAGPYLIYGSGMAGSCIFMAGTAGMYFNSPSGYSNTTGGNFLLFQLINSDALTGSYNYSLSAGLDKGRFPYPGPPTSDSPWAFLDPSWTTLTRSFNATMFLMWQSNTTGSIPVPLGYQTWQFNGTANCSTSCGSASNWTATTNGTPGNVGIFTASNSSQTSVGSTTLVYGFPTWQGQAH